MKKAGSRERLRKAPKRLEATSLVGVGGMFNGLSEKLPDNQMSQIDDPVPMTDLETYDLRTNKVLKNIEGKVVEPVPLVIDGRRYEHQVRFGGYRFETPMDTTKIVGLTNFGNGLYVQPAPLQPFLRVGQKAVGEYENKQGKINNNTDEGRAQVAEIIKKGAIDGGGRSYRNACFEAIHEDSPTKTITVLVLGPQRADGRHENAEAYEELSDDSKKPLSPNIHEFQGMQQVTGNAGELINVRVIHANVNKFDEQHLDSTDLEALVSIYADTLGSGNPLTIHCTDGLDRAGGISFAMHLMKNYENVFVPGNEGQTLSNIMKEHAFMQDQRGGYFCTAHEGRLIGAFQLATIMKCITMSQELSVTLAVNDPVTYKQLRGKDYVDQIEVLAKQERLSPSAQELLTVLVTRAKTEQVYFSKFTKETEHPLIETFNQLDSRYQLSQRQDARVLISDIQEMLRKGHNLDPLIRRPGQKSQQVAFRNQLGSIQQRIGDGENPADFHAKLTEMKAQLGAAGSGVLGRLKRKAPVSEVPKSAPTVVPVSASPPPPAEPVNPVASGTLAGAMLSSSKRSSSEVEHGPSEASQMEATVQKIKGLQALSESGPQAFEITMNDVEGDFNAVVKVAKDAAGKNDDIVEFDGNCVIKTENACIHLSKNENGETRLSVQCQEDKQDKAFEDASRIVHILGDKDCHMPDSLRDNTQKQDVQSKIENLDAQRNQMY